MIVLNTLGVNKLFELSKQARKSKDYALEKDYLLQAIGLNPTNPKFINALIRNLRKEGNVLELRKWLEKLYTLNPNGKVLFELMQLEQSVGNFVRVKELLYENERIDPNSKKVKERIKKAEEKESLERINSTLFTLIEEEVELVKGAREIIYGDDAFMEKQNKITSLLGSMPEEIILSILSELYKKESSISSALSFIRRYKEKLNPEIDGKKIKLANRLLELVSSKKTKRYHWAEFWISNTSVLYGEKDSPKILIKNSLNNWLV